jgi:predicted choloylglycine hydrolase
LVEGDAWAGRAGGSGFLLMRSASGYHGTLEAVEFKECRVMRFRLIVAVALAATAPAVRGDEPFRFPEARFGKGQLKYHEGVPVLVLEGTPAEIGAQAGVLTGKACAEVANYPADIVERLAGSAGSRWLWPVVLNRGERLFKNFPADYRQEFEAGVKAGHVDRARALVGNTMFDLKADLTALFGCSALLVDSSRSRDGKPIFGRNMDYPSLGYLHRYSLVTVCRPEGKHAFAAIGFPGMLGCVSGMNDAGLALAVLETTGAPREEGLAFDPDGVPFMLCYRRLLEECATVPEAEHLLRGMKRTTSTNLAICDRHEGAVFEVTPSRVIVRRPERGIAVCTNHFCSPQLRLGTPDNRFHTQDRYARLERMSARQEKMSPRDVEKYMHGVSQSRQTLQTMVFRPATLELDLAVSSGNGPAADEEFHWLELAPLLRPGGRQANGAR